MTLAEAMVRECPVVAPDRGPFTDFIRHGDTGLVYQLGDIQDGASRVGDLLSEGALRRSLGISARENILMKHAPDVAVLLLAKELFRIVAK